MEALVAELGGCGKFQWCTVFWGKFAKITVIFTMYAMMFMGQKPDFRCDDGIFDTGNLTSTDAFDNVCDTHNATQCANIDFQEDVRTIVNEWDLVCERDWMPALVTTLQMFGVLIGCFVAGHLGDFIGRKPTLFLGLTTLIIFNGVAILSSGVRVYAAIRFVLGLGCGFYLTVHYNLMTEFVPSKWRALIVALPVFSLGGAMFSLVAWALQDWKYIHLVTATIGIPFILSFGFIQESVRWMFTKGRRKDAVKAMTFISRVNGVSPLHSSQLEEAVADGVKQTSARTYTVLDLFKRKETRCTTLCLFFAWMGISYSFYGLTFGVSSLSGDLYLNMFLMNIIDAPVSMSTMFLVNKFGRKYSCMAGFIVTGLCGIVVGVVQYIDTPHRGVVTNVFALASKAGNGIGWGSLMIYTLELYPTVVRSISYGLHNTAARVGSMIAPQMVFLNDLVPGIMYFTSGIALLVPGILFFWFPETNGEDLKDDFRDTGHPGETVHQNSSNLDHSDAVVKT